MKNIERASSNLSDSAIRSKVKVVENNNSKKGENVNVKVGENS